MLLLAAFIYIAARGGAVQAQGTSSLLIDRDMTVGAGAAVATTVGEAIARIEDAFVPDRLVGDDGVLRRAANVSYRLARIALFDLPQEYWLVVANHEVFGHGARLRERFRGGIGYRIGVPPPYGAGGGATSFEFDREPTAAELLAVSVGGMEAGSVAAELMARQAVRRGRLHPRDALRYLGFELDTIFYVLSTGDDPEESGHDVFEFLQVYNAAAAQAGASALNARTLRREALVGLANPLLAFGVYGIGRYVWSGAADASIPTLRFRGVRYLPLFRYRLTPFGTEMAMHTVFMGPAREGQVDVRIGRSIGARPWGIGLRRTNVTSWRQWTLGVGGEVWKQPAIAGRDAEVRLGAARWGAGVRARLERPVAPVWFAAMPLTVVVELGAKRAGYVPGEPLGGGVVARAGVGLPLGPSR